MPIPPRPIPTAPAHSRRPAARPGVVTRKEHKDHRGSLHSLVADSRAEMQLLPAFGSSAPPLHGIRITAGSPSSSGSSTRASTPPAGFPSAASREVALTTLMMDGRGRPKRTGAAAQLGFDFVPRPEVVAMGDNESITPPAVTEPVPTPPRPSLWPWSALSAATSPRPAASPLVTAVEVGEQLAEAPEPRLAGPATPPLEPTRPDEDDDDWEHVYVGVDDDDTVSIVGQLELEEPPVKHENSKLHPSYAAAATINT
ncbi:uncharacterized protein EHS24_000230 [Apiotrichum porosum]|uniref:Uncharacterized protein n=1 Tax=Apiotrichum porosum TaxID=105984 RepID=A0A427Y9P7_9TREE|nr:uncharacterized protein EHS24_000230 [Apiotrichum porosum]RSH87714.1 hypothetical protein EHS24_000230 [Apiotrichum porosum]